jgi:cellulose synthase/poly-beta-1,6-N-acetylglucosamine synthase-like glycosyltransferase
MLSVLVPASNCSSTLERTLSSILSNEFPRESYEIIVVDNGSVDNTLEIARRFPTRTVICRKRGQSAALNMGIREAAGDTICITNSDVVVPKDWLKKISEYLDAHPDVEGVGGLVTPPLEGQRNDIERLIGSIYFEDQAFPQKIVEPQVGKVSGSLYTANCALRKRTLVAAGGFDESLLEFMDIDLSWRLVKKGKRLKFLPYVRVVHLLFPHTLPTAFRQQFKWGTGLAAMTKKHRTDLNVYTVWGTTASYRFAKIFLKLLIHAKHERKKQMLRIFNYIAFNLGRLYGQRL